MRHRSNSSPTVNLFAFLDILICTMGALILMLMVVTTRQLRKESLAQVLAELKTPPAPVVAVESPLADPLPPPAQTVILAQPEVEPEPPAPEPIEPVIDPREVARAEQAAALAQRERELNELLAEWRHKVNSLASERDQHAKTLAQRQRLKEVAARQVVTLQNEVQELEVRLGSLTGELSAIKTGDATEQERQKILLQIAALQQRLKAAQSAAAGGDSKYMVVPFDAQSGTARRPILIECTADGLRFIPENVMIRPDDLEGFTPRVNPLLAGSNSLVTYWTAWNLKQAQPARQPEPYVLLLVRPSGTVAYYVAMKMLAALKQPHGYELIEEDTQLQEPPVDAGAKAACEAAVKRLLAEREQIKEFASKGKGGGGFARGGGAFGDAFRTGAAGSGARAGSINRFEVTDVADEENEVGSRSWERIENFAGRNSRPATTGNPSTVAGGTSGPAPSQRNMKGNEDESAANIPSADESVRRPGSVGRDVGRRDAVISQGNASSTEADGADGDTPPRAATGIERIADTAGTDSAPGAAGGQAGGATPLDIGLGSTGPTAVPVYDRRTKKSSTSKPLEPEMLARKRWGLSAPDAAIGLEREIRINVEPNRLVIGGKHAIRMGEGESKQETFERLATVIDLQAREWGQPPQGFFWTPSLKFVVAEGGNPHYETARSLAERAGLVTSKEYAADNPEKPTRTPATPASAKPARTLRGGTP